MTKKQRAAVVDLAAAMESDKPIRTIMRERGHLPEIRRATPGETDIELLAAFIRERIPNPPKRIAEIVARFAKKPASAFRKAARPTTCRS